jgi:hypothetical protein
MQSVAHSKSKYSPDKGKVSLKGQLAYNFSIYSPKTEIAIPLRWRHFGLNQVYHIVQCYHTYCVT